MKSRDGQSQREEKSRREKIREENVRRKKMQMREKVGKSPNTVFFQWFVAPEGRKVGSLKRRVRSHLARWEMKKCTPLWREAHLEVKMRKALHIRAIFGSWDVEKVHAIVARSTFRSQNVQSTEMSKKCTPLWREAHFEVKMLKTPHVRATFGSWDVEKVHAVVARSTFRSQKCKKLRGTEHFWTLRCRFAWQAQGIVHLVKSEQNVRVCRIPKNDGRRVTFEEDLQRCISRGRRSTKDMFIRDVKRSGRWFHERVCILEHQIFRFAKMILRDRCSTSYDLASIFRFRGRRSTLDRWSGKIAKSIGTRPSALHSTFHFWRKSRRIASFLMLSTSKHEEVSRKSFVFKLADRQIERER